MKILLDEMMTQEEEVLLVERSRKGHTLSRNRILKAGLQLSSQLADHYAQEGVSREDLVSEGLHQFFHCLQKFNPAEGSSFFRYAAWWIKYGMSKLIERKLVCCYN